MQLCTWRPETTRICAPGKLRITNMSTQPAIFSLSLRPNRGLVAEVRNEGSLTYIFPCLPNRYDFYAAKIPDHRIYSPAVSFILNHYFVKNKKPHLSFGWPTVVKNAYLLARTSVNHPGLCRQRCRVHSRQYHRPARNTSR
jgi:hypothetical protein